MDLKQFEADLIWDVESWYSDVKVEKVSVTLEEQKVAVQTMVSFNGEKAIPIDSTTVWKPGYVTASQTYLVHKIAQSIFDYIGEQVEKAKSCQSNSK